MVREKLLRKFAPRERNEYISEMETERDRINQLAYAEKKGIEKERQSTISRLLAYGMSPEEIAKALNLTLEEIAAAK